MPEFGDIHSDAVSDIFGDKALNGLNRGYLPPGYGPLAAKREAAYDSGDEDRKKLLKAVMEKFLRRFGTTELGAEGNVSPLYSPELARQEPHQIDGGWFRR